MATQLPINASQARPQQRSCHLHKAFALPLSALPPPAGHSFCSIRLQFLYCCKMFSFQLVSVYSAHTQKAPRHAPPSTLSSWAALMQLLVAGLSPLLACTGIVFTKIMEFDARFIDRNQAKSINGKCNQFYGRPAAMIHLRNAHATNITHTPRDARDGAWAKAKWSCKLLNGSAGERTKWVSCRTRSARLCGHANIYEEQPEQQMKMANKKQQNRNCSNTRSRC